MKIRNLLVVALLGMSFAACGGGDDDDSTDTPMIDGGGGGMPPSITKVEWAPVGACTAGTASQYSVTVTVTDPDTAEAMLTYSGNVSSCGAITGMVSMFSCPNAAPYGGSVTVKDPENNSDTQAFTIGVCQSGMAP